MKRYVLTGAPGCGKSSVLLELENRGFEVIREAAQDVIQRYHAKGIEKPWEDVMFQDEVLKLQLFREDKFQKDKTYFLDRGVIDGLAYAREKHPSRWWIEHQSHHRRKEGRYGYDVIFFLNPLDDVETNSIRREGIEEAKMIDGFLREEYHSRRYFGDRFVEIPNASIEERADLILQGVEHYITKTRPRELQDLNDMYKNN